MIKRQIRKISAVTLLLVLAVVFQNCAESVDPGYSNQSSKGVGPALVSVTDDTSIEEGQTLQLDIAVQGEAVAYKWFFNDVEIAGKTDSVMSIANIQLNQSGIYKVEAANPFGTLTESIAVTVTVKPVSPNPPPPPPPKPVCQIWYQAKNDSALGAAAKDGAYSEYFSGQDKDCNDNYCGIRMGASCTAGDEVRLVYQYMFINTPAAEVTSPWSGLTGSIQWGAYSQIYSPGHVRDECRAPLKCGIRVKIETKTGQVCKISYRFKANSQFSPVTMDGAWAYLPDMGTRDENCNSNGSCGMLATMTCP